MEKMQKSNQPTQEKLQWQSSRAVILAKKYQAIPNSNNFILIRRYLQNSVMPQQTSSILFFLSIY